MVTSSVTGSDPVAELRISGSATYSTTTTAWFVEGILLDADVTGHYSFVIGPEPAE